MKKEVPYKFVIREDGPFLIIVDGYEIKSKDFIFSNKQISFPSDDIILNVSSNPSILKCVSTAIEIHILCLIDEESRVIALRRT